MDRRSRRRPRRHRAGSGPDAPRTPARQAAEGARGRSASAPRHDRQARESRSAPTLPAAARAAAERPRTGSTVRASRSLRDPRRRRGNDGAAGRPGGGSQDPDERSGPGAAVAFGGAGPGRRADGKDADEATESKTGVGKEPGGGDRGGCRHLVSAPIGPTASVNGPSGDREVRIRDLQTDAPARPRPSVAGARRTRCELSGLRSGCLRWLAAA